MLRKAAMAGTVLALVLAGCGEDQDEDAGGDDAPGTAAQSTTVPATTGPAPATTVRATTVPATTGAVATTAGSNGSPSGFCADLEATTGLVLSLVTALFNEDTDALAGAVADAEPSDALFADLRSSAPADIRADIDREVAQLELLLDSLDGIDLSDADAVEAAVEDSEFFAEPRESSERVEAYAAAECGIEPDTTLDVALPDLPEPADPCALVNPRVVATAAGLNLRSDEKDVGANLNMGMYWIRGCAYDGGAMTISTVTYAGDVDDIVDDWVRTTERNGGTVTTDFERATLPESAVIMTTNGYQTLAVFDAPTPFSVGFADVDDPAALVSAAEAVLTATS